MCDGDEREGTGGWHPSSWSKGTTNASVTNTAVQTSEGRAQIGGADRGAHAVKHPL